MTVTFEPDSNPFLRGEGYFQVNTFDMTTQGTGPLCETGHCQYSITDGKISPNSFTGGYLFDGQLKSSVQSGGAKISKIIEMNAFLDKDTSIEQNGKTTETVDGHISFGRSVVMPDFQFQIMNGTYQVDPEHPVLQLTASIPGASFGARSTITSPVPSGSPESNNNPNVLH